MPTAWKTASGGAAALAMTWALAPATGAQAGPPSNAKAYGGGGGHSSGGGRPQISAGQSRGGGSYGGAKSLSGLREAFWQEPDAFVIKQSPSARRESYER